LSIRKIMVSVFDGASVFYVTVKRVIADTGMIADAKWQTRTKCAFKIVGFAHHW